MNITVMMASGDEDVWEDAADAVDDRGSLVVLYPTLGYELSDSIKTLEVTRELDRHIPQDGQFHEPQKVTKTEVFQVAAVYAPGMWMKVEF